MSRDWFAHNSEATHDFDKTDEFAWLILNPWKYGFIMRYPQGKIAVTGIVYEPWHYRFVGVKRAKEIYESGLCLEEFFEQLATGNEQMRDDEEMNRFLYAHPGE